jgi:lysozyme family protein
MSNTPTHVHAYIDHLIKVEGGYVNHKNDKGGETCWGITVEVARAFGYQGRMQDLSQATAKEIYLERYWIQPGFDKVNAIAPHVAQELFDTGVNMGTGTASKFLQRALNVLNNQGRDFPEIEADGALGKMTLHCLAEFLKRRGAPGSTVLWRMLNSQQGVRYIELSEKTRTQDDFQFGWQANRVGGAPA